MPELIDKKRTEAKVFLIARLFIDRPDREVELVKAVIHRCCEEIDKQPTIEPEVQHGHWIEPDSETIGKYRDDGCVAYYTCSCCKEISKTDYDFCPNCGAKMEGGADE